MDGQRIMHGIQELQQMYGAYRQGGINALNPQQRQDFDFIQELARAADQTVDDFLNSPLNNVIELRNRLTRSDFGFAIFYLHQVGVSFENIHKFFKVIRNDEAINFITSGAKKAGKSTYEYIKSFAYPKNIIEDQNITEDNKTDYIRLAAQYSDKSLDYILKSAAIPYISSSLERWRTNLRTRVRQQGPLGTVAAGDLIGILLLLRSELGIKFENMYDYLLITGNSEAAQYLKESAKYLKISKGEFIESIEKELSVEGYTNYPYAIQDLIGVVKILSHHLGTKETESKAFKALAETTIEPIKSSTQLMKYEQPELEPELPELIPDFESQLKSARVTLEPVIMGPKKTRFVEGGKTELKSEPSDIMAESKVKRVYIPHAIYMRTRGPSGKALYKSKSAGEYVSVRNEDFIKFIKPYLNKREFENVQKINTIKAVSLPSQVQTAELVKVIKTKKDKTEIVPLPEVLPPRVEFPNKQYFDAFIPYLLPGAQSYVIGDKYYVPIKDFGAAYRSNPSVTYLRELVRLVGAPDSEGVSHIREGNIPAFILDIPFNQGVSMAEDLKHKTLDLENIMEEIMEELRELPMDEVINTTPIISKIHDEYESIMGDIGDFDDIDIRMHTINFMEVLDELLYNLKRQAALEELSRQQGPLSEPFVRIPEVYTMAGVGQVIMDTDTIKKYNLLQNELLKKQMVGNIAIKKGEDPFVSDSVKIRKSILKTPVSSYSNAEALKRGLVPAVERYVVMGEYVM